MNCPKCGKSEEVFTWTRDITKDGVHLLGHYCRGCGKHFDSEKKEEKKP